MPLFLEIHLLPQIKNFWWECIFVFGLEKGSGIFLSRNYDSAWLYCISNYCPAFNLILRKSCWKDCQDLSQLGFWPGYETKILVDDLWWDWNKGTQPSCFLLNLSMAFKTINHNFPTPAPEVGSCCSSSDQPDLIRTVVEEFHYGMPQSCSVSICN